ncbi:unnamed protein product [Ectocarpus sp. 12 AP-2014]
MRGGTVVQVGSGGGSGAGGCGGGAGVKKHKSKSGRRRSAANKQGGQQHVQQQQQQQQQKQMREEQQHQMRALNDSMYRQQQQQHEAMHGIIPNGRHESSNGNPPMLSHRERQLQLQQQQQQQQQQGMLRQVIGRGGGGGGGRGMALTQQHQLPPSQLPQHGRSGLASLAPPPRIPSRPPSMPQQQQQQQRQHLSPPPSQREQDGRRHLQQQHQHEDTLSALYLHQPPDSLTAPTVDMFRGDGVGGGGTRRRGSMEPGGGNLGPLGAVGAGGSGQDYEPRVSRINLDHDRQLQQQMSGLGGALAQQRQRDRQQQPRGGGVVVGGGGGELNSMWDDLQAERALPQAKKLQNQQQMGGAVLRNDPRLDQRLDPWGDQGSNNSGNNSHPRHDQQLQGSGALSGLGIDPQRLGGFGGGLSEAAPSPSRGLLFKTLQSQQQPPPPPKPQEGVSRFGSSGLDGFLGGVPPPRDDSLFYD